MIWAAITTYGLQGRRHNGFMEATVTMKRCRRGHNRGRREIFVASNSILMKKWILSKRAVFLLMLQLAFFLNIHANLRIPRDTSAPQNLDYIDPTIGNMGQLLEPTRPTAHLPNQLIRFTPQRNDYLDDQIYS